MTLKIMEKIFKGFNESDRRATERKRDELLEDEKRIADSNGDPIAALGKMIRDEKKTRCGTGLFRLTGGRAVRHVFFRPAVAATAQLECEKWWFSLENTERERIMSGRIGNGGFRNHILRRTLLLGIEETGHLNRLPGKRECDIEGISGRFMEAAAREALKYWPVLTLFSLMSLVYAVNFPLQSGLLALAGFMLCLLILWHCRMIKVKRDMGLRYFCPFAVFFILSAYISEMAGQQTCAGADSSPAFRER